MPNLFPLLAGYNAWANLRVYAAAAALSDADYRADRGAFFRSVHGTLNHILVADRIWMHRFTGEGAAPTRLDEILFEDLSDLAREREREDARIAHWVGGLSEADLERTVRYRTITNPKDVEQPLAPILLHLFNHQTHHRGQVHAMLTGLGAPSLALDLPWFQRETGMGMS